MNRFSHRMLLAAALAFSGVLTLRADADAEGSALAAELIAQRPAESLTNHATLRIKARGQPVRELPLRITIEAGSPTWTVTYAAGSGTNAGRLMLVRDGSTGRSYTHLEPSPDGLATTHPTGNATMVPFAGSDFWVGDLALEFLHWPGQRIVKREMRRSRFCLVLQSTNPVPAAGAYSRVLSWIDKENRGIVIAEAYDSAGKLIKEFMPKDFTKVNGRWELTEMEIANPQANSTTTIEFEPSKPSPTAPR